MSEVSMRTFEQLRERWGGVSSWAVWSEPRGRRTGAWVSDLGVFEPGSPESKLDELRSHVVLLGLNSGVRDRRPDDGRAWSMFHHPVGRDFMLADAIRDTPFWGAYLTDFFKGLPTRTGAELRAFLRTRPATADEAVTELRRELEVLSSEPPLLVALGREVTPFVHEHFGRTHRVVSVSHYSRAIAKPAYRQEFAVLAPLLGAAS